MPQVKSVASLQHSQKAIGEEIGKASHREADRMMSLLASKGVAMLQIRHVEASEVVAIANGHHTRRT
jgi:hypothetical protein